MTSEKLITEFLFRFLLNSAVLLFLLRFVYFRVSKNRDSLFGFFLFGHGVYLISALMHDVEISMGFAFGLFAVLSMLRYRTESISIRDMTYLFVVIVVSLVFAVGPLHVAGLAVINVTLCVIVAICESTVFAPRTTVQRIVYDSAVNVSTENRAALIQDLEKRLGVKVLDVEIGEVDLIRDSTDLRLTSVPTAV